jgi:large subunit ribosomal protein L10
VLFSLNREEKKQIVEALHEKFSKAKVVIVTDYKGMGVRTLNDLRRRLKEAEIDYQVVKNTLLVRASEGTAVASIKERFKGPNAVALSYDDPVAPAKLLTKFANENEKLEIKFGVINGRAIDLNAIKALSNLPPREVLLGHVLSVMNAVPTALVTALSNIPVRLLNVLQAIREQKEAA